MTNVPDAIAITNLLYRYAELIDAGDYEGIGAHLAHAVITTDGSDHETRGADAVAAMYHTTTRKYDDGTPLTKHVITNPIVEVADDGLTGTCRSYYTVFQKAGDQPLRPDHQRPLPRRVREGRRGVALQPSPHGRRPDRRPVTAPADRPAVSSRGATASRSRISARNAFGSAAFVAEVSASRAVAYDTN